MSDFITVNSTVFNSWFETIQGKELVNIKRLAEAFDKEEKHCIEIVTENTKIFIGEHFEFSRQKTGKRGRPEKDHYLTRDGCLAFLNRLDYNRYDPVISNFIIEFQKWIVSTAGKVIDGKLTPAQNLKLNYTEERVAASDNHKLLMASVKKYEAPKYPSKSHLPYQRESRAINEDVAGVHIKGLNDKLNSVGLRIKNEAYVADRALMEVGIPFETRHPVVRRVLDSSYPRRELTDMLMSTEQRARISNKCPESQRGISDFCAVTA